MNNTVGFPGHWLHYIKRPDNVGLSINEVRRKYLTEQLEFEQQMIQMVNASSGGKGGGQSQSGERLGGFPSQLLYEWDGIPKSLENMYRVQTQSDLDGLNDPFGVYSLPTNSDEPYYASDFTENGYYGSGHYILAWNGTSWNEYPYAQYVIDNFNNPTWGTTTATTLSTGPVGTWDGGPPVGAETTVV